MEIITRINWVDVLVLIVVLRISYVAFQEGLSHEIFPLIGTVATLVIALHYYVKIGLLICQNLAKIPVDLANLLSFLVLIIVIGLILKVLRVVLDKVIKITWHPLIERFGGLVFGVLRGSVVASMVLTFIVLMPLSYLQWSVRDRSLVGMHFLRIGPTIYAKVLKALPPAKTKGSSKKSEEVSRDKEDIVRELVSDKSIAPTKAEKAKEKIPEWEKPVRF